MSVVSVARFFFVGSWFLSLLVVSLCLPALAFAARDGDSAQFVSVAGDVKNSLHSNRGWRPSSVGQFLSAGNYVKTGALSKAGLLLSDQTQIRINQNSLFQVKVIADQKKSQVRQIKKKSWAKKSGKKTILSIDKGSAWIKSKNVPDSLHVETPAATAAIHGTEWLLDVTADGQTRLTVLSGEVHLSNAYGAVSVNKNEQALVTAGQPPVKSKILSSKERTQWVGHFSVNPQRYAEFKNADRPQRELEEIAAALTEGRLLEAQGLLNALSNREDAPAICWLLLTNLAIYQGDFAGASKYARQGGRRFPSDQRLSALPAKIALLQGRFDLARSLVDEALSLAPQSGELLLVKGELELLSGHAASAKQAYLQATDIEGEDGRGWLGLGRVESGSGHYRSAKSSILKALEQDEFIPGAIGELANVEAQADRLELARSSYQKAIDLTSDDYVALAGIGLLEIKSGNPQQALDYLLRSTTIEPGYARALIYTAVAYYQLGRIQDALNTLQAAAEIDSNDPLPHLYSSMIFQDMFEPGSAVDSSRAAMQRMPYLKSLQQVVNNRRGSANVGSAFSLFGQENRATHYAHKSYLSNWASSHMFLADRYQGRFKKNSELMQGFLSDPTLFGASPVWSSLIPTAGRAITAGLRFNSSDDIHVLEPAFSLNGYQNATLPFAYFGEGIVTEVQPRDRPLDGEAITGTLGLGAKLSPELALFSYLNAFDADLDQSQALIFDRIQGHDRRLDFGFSIHFSPQNQLWLKAGAGDSESERKSRHNDFITDPACSPSADFMGSCRSDAEMDGYDIQYRQIVASDDRLEVSFGWEAASVDSSVQSDFSGATSSAGALSPDKTIMLRDDAEDRSQTVYLSAQYKLGAQLKAHAALDYSDYRKELVSGGYLQQGDLHVPLAAQSYSTKTNKLSPRFGLEYQHDDRLSARCAYQQWLRPASAHSLAPMATAGIALADELVLPGGEIERARLQIDWEFNDASYVNFFYDWSSTDNLSRGIGDVLNQRMELAELDRLRQQDYTNLPTLEQLEERPVFAKGEVDSVGVNFETILFDGLSLSAGYIYSEGENTGKGFSGLDLPYIPQHRALIGATWFPLERCRLQLQGVYRSSRPVDEPNTVMLDEDFTTTVTGQWQSNDKRYKLEAYAANLSTSQKDTLVGVNLLWRTDL